MQIEHFPTGVLVHQLAYTKKILKRFYMDKAHHLSSLMVVRSLDVKNDLFRLCENGEELLGLEVPYLSVIDALMYLTNYARLDISFPINLLTRNQSCNCLDMLMQNTFQTYIRQDHTHGMCLIVMERLFHGIPLSR